MLVSAALIRRVSARDVRGRVADAHHRAAAVRPARPASPAAPAPSRVRPAARRARQERRRLHRLLSVRLRRLDQEQPGAVRSRRAGAASTSCRSATTTRCARSSTPPPPAPTPESKKIGDYYASCMDEAGIDAKGAAPLDPLLKKIAALASVNDLAPLRRRAAHHRRQRLLPVRIAGRLQGRVGGDGDRRSGRPRPARSRLLLQRRCEVGRAAEAVRRARRPDVGAAGDASRSGDAPRSRSMAIETALAKSALDAVSRRDPNKVYHKMSNAELQALTPQFHVGALLHAASARRRSTRSTSPSPTSSRRSARSLATHAARRDQGLPALAASCTPRAPVLSKPFVDENFALLRHGADRREGAAAAVEALRRRTPTATSARRSARRSSRRRSARRPRPTRCGWCTSSKRRSSRTSTA